jgi:hypothetical protein
VDALNLKMVYKSTETYRHASYKEINVMSNGACIVVT